MGTASTAQGAAILPALERIIQAPSAPPPPAPLPGDHPLAQSLTHMHISKPAALAPQRVVPKPVPLPVHLPTPPLPQPSIGASQDLPQHAKPATVPSSRRPHAQADMSFASWARPEPSLATNVVRHSHPSCGTHLDSVVLASGCSNFIFFLKCSFGVLQGPQWKVCWCTDRGDHNSDTIASLVYQPSLAGLPSGDGHAGTDLSLLSRSSMEARNVVAPGSQGDGA